MYELLLKLINQDQVGGNKRKNYLVVADGILTTLTARERLIKAPSGKQEELEVV